MRYPEGRLLVMARAPLAGRTKTRLIPALGAEGAAILQRYLVERQLTEAVDSETAPVELWGAGDCQHPFFEESRARSGVALYCQQGGNLGERLQHALETALRRAEFAIVIGCDIPELDASVLEHACEVMRQGADAVLVPAEDGGYALLGVRQAAPLLFNQIDWGGERVLAQTRERVQRLGWHWQELPALWDVDRPQDLPRLLKLGDLPANIRQLLKEAGVDSRTEEAVS